MFEWWANFRKRRVLRSYQTRLRSKLLDLYGRSESYTHGQVNRAIRESRVNQNWVIYAYALYCVEQEYMAAWRTHQPTLAAAPDPAELRREFSDIGVTDSATFVGGDGGGGEGLHEFGASDGGFGDGGGADGGI